MTTVGSEYHLVNGQYVYNGAIGRTSAPVYERSIERVAPVAYERNVHSVGTTVHAAARQVGEARIMGEYTLVNGQYVYRGETSYPDSYERSVSHTHVVDRHYQPASTLRTVHERPTVEYIGSTHATSYAPSSGTVYRTLGEARQVSVGRGTIPVARAYNTYTDEL